MTRNKIMFISSLLLFGIIIRLMPYFMTMMNVDMSVHSTNLPWNFSPMTGICLFSGAIFAARYSTLVPIFILFVCDVGIYFFTGKTDYTVFSNKPILYVTYLSIILIALSGNQFLKRYSLLKIIGAGVGAEVLFFLMTNGASWWLGDRYLHTFSGLMTCYAAGIPFVGRSFVSTLFYAPAIFYAYHYFCLSETTLIPKINRVETNAL
jgi:Family of unknown function (DUF6580)